MARGVARIPLIGSNLKRQNGRGEDKCSSSAIVSGQKTQFNRGKIIKVLYWKKSMILLTLSAVKVDVMGEVKNTYSSQILGLGLSDSPAMTDKNL